MEGPAPLEGVILVQIQAPAPPCKGRLGHKWCRECRPDVALKCSVSEAVRLSWANGRKPSVMPADHGQRISRAVRWKVEARIAAWRDGTNSPRRVNHSSRRFLINEVAHGKCQQCGWCERNPVTGNLALDIDHINGDHSDNRFENLRVLCPNCHALTPTYGFIGGHLGSSPST